MYIVATLVGLTYVCGGVNIGALIWGSHHVWPLSVVAVVIAVVSGIYQTGRLIQITQSRQRIASMKGLS